MRWPCPCAVCRGAQRIAFEIHSTCQLDRHNLMENEMKECTRNGLENGIFQTTQFTDKV